MLQGAAVGAIAGGLYGASRQSNKEAHAWMWGSAGAAAGSLLVALNDDPDKEAEKLRKEAARLKEQLDELESPKVEAQATGLLGARVPERFRRLVNPGEWKVLKIDQWVEGEGENQLIHQDMVMELVPPALLPNQR